MRRALLALAALLLLAAGVAAVYLIDLRRDARDVRGSSTVEFVPTEPPPPTRPPIPGVAWPTYRFSSDRLGAVGFRHRPPYRSIWRFGARQLVEFPPAVAYGRLYFANNPGVLFAVNGRTGRRAWRFRSGRCTAASPAVSKHAVFQTFLNVPPCNRRPSPRLTGELVKLAAGFGRVLWRKRIGPSESSPLVAGGLVYVGDWRGRVYAFDERNGRLRWSFRTGAQIKGALALAGRRLYVGSYDHHVYALHARTGRLLWRSRAQRRLGRRGTFYSTPAVAYGRVYIGSTDGKVYSFGAASGKLRWSQGTGGYVYASPAVWRRSVYVGSYSGRFYALDAATGDVRWSFDARGPVSGSAVVIDGIVYFSTLKERTWGLDARTGRVRWSFPDGKYAAVVADERRVYVVGHARVYGLVPRAGRR